MGSSSHILVAPLDWGLGHATRCVPLVNALLQQGAQVRLAGSGKSLAVLKNHFPGLEARILPGYDIQFKSFGSLISQLPGIMRTIREEREVLAGWVAEGWISRVISDNRYGLYHPDAHSAVLCHQLTPMPPFGASWAHHISRNLHGTFLRHFDEIWVPDQPGSRNLSGVLSRPATHSPPVRWLGPLSRFAGFEPPETSSEESLVALLSGPEPQRTMFEKKLLAQFETLGLPGILIQGKPGPKTESQTGNLRVISFLDGPELALRLLRARAVIARPGYSSLMDFAALGLQQLILIPTPGQTEQQYLGRRLRKQGRAWVVEQEKFSLRRALEEVKSCTGLPTQPQHSALLEEVITQFIQ